MKGNIFKDIKAKGYKIAIIQARFNKEITNKLSSGAIRALKKVGLSENDIDILQVPGSFEIPLACQKTIKKNKYHGIITIGAIIKGETVHFEYISQASIDGIMSVMLKNNFPISLGVITTYNMFQAKARAKNNKNNKGYEAALALVEMLIDEDK